MDIAAILHEKPNAGEGMTAVEYDTSGRASCKKGCGRGIVKGSARVIIQEKSGFHDGFDRSYLHIKCAVRQSYHYSRVTQLRGWESLRYEDLLTLREGAGEKVDQKAPKESRLREEMDAFWALREALIEEASLDTMSAILEANNRPTTNFKDGKPLKAEQAAGMVAELLLWGRLAPCPGCKGHSLAYRTGHIVCKGWLSGFGKCLYRAMPPEGKWFKPIIPDDCLEELEWVGDWIMENTKALSELMDDSEVAAATAALAALATDSGSSSSSSSSASGAAKEEQKKQKQKKQKQKKQEDTDMEPADGGDGSETKTKKDAQDGAASEEVPDGQELAGMTIAFAGRLPLGQAQLTKLVQDHGGSVGKDVDDSTTHLVASESEAKKGQASKKINAALQRGIPVANMQFLEDLTSRQNEGIKLRRADVLEASGFLLAGSSAGGSVAASAAAGDTSMADASADDDAGAASSKRSRSRGRKAASKAQAARTPSPAGKKKSRNGNRVLARWQGLPMWTSGEDDEEGGSGKGEKKDAADDIQPPEPGSEILKLDEKAPVTPKAKIYVDDDGITVYNVMLNAIDLKSGQNKFYRLQLIDTGSGGSSKYLVYRRWGRTGDDGYSTFGGGYAYKKPETTDYFGSIANAKAKFAEVFLDKTANSWDDRFRFEKKPKKYNYVELSRGNEEEEDEAKVDQKRKERGKGSKCSLDPRVQSLIELIFDSKKMVETMSQFAINSKKMPLGKLSRNTVMRGYEVLKEVEKVLNDMDVQFKSGGSAAGETKTSTDAVLQARLHEACTRFYSVIPTTDPVVIDSVQRLKDKMEMMEALLEIICAKDIMAESDKADVSRHPADVNYELLHTELVPLASDSAEYRMVCDYVKNTHGSSHTDYTLEVESVFVVKREHEEARFAKWKDLHNRQLLWHGSRLTNWIGILSQGLRIAPPEAPCTGYMFGKGVYFANMVSKSANYCFTNAKNNTGVMLLCEVALGDMYELTGAKYMEKAPPGYHSTKGKGGTYPPPSKNAVLPNGTIVPLGKPSGKDSSVFGSLFYDEFIVYDVSQICCRYLLRLKFNYKQSSWY